MKKKSLIISLLITLISCGTADVSKNILETKNIREIESFLATAHKEDPRRSVLKPKLIALKNEEWTKGKKNAKPMQARPILSEIPNSVMKNSNEAEEFKRLIASTSGQHKDKTTKLLNTMFNEDISSKEVIILFKNQSDCNLVMKIQGKEFYNMAIPSHGENFIVINKGSYTLTSNVCDVLYSSRKDINKSIFLTINNPEKVENKTISMKN
ncbi:hypothetical protein SAMN05421664_2858 [Chryseobacterium soldanellicola]|uniref:DUF6759 domain-containing protein n=1 Tax=Chryseobacterium soldanellicola TaxID=311333 RepID=A0A1H1EA42_9FLAO|nr:DUF6759 domain-containing protein [Chryseobacterium soldanellicola]SDQ85607.1 hypothetical protein SAMN05421664_2858 [Chryseobacterium soldanellicola]